MNDGYLIGLDFLTLSEQEVVIKISTTIRPPGTHRKPHDGQKASRQDNTNSMKIKGKVAGLGGYRIDAAFVVRKTRTTEMGTRSGPLPQPD